MIPSSERPLAVHNGASYWETSMPPQPRKRSGDATAACRKTLPKREVKVIAFINPPTADSGRQYVQSHSATGRSGKTIASQAARLFLNWQQPLPSPASADGS